MQSEPDELTQVLTEIASVIDRHMAVATQDQGNAKPGPEAVSAAIRRVLARRVEPIPVFVEE